LISWSPPCLSLWRGNSLFALKEAFVIPGLDPGIHAVTWQCVEALLEWIAGSSPAMTRGEGEDREQAGWGGAVPGAGGMARDTGTCSSARIDARNCSIRTLPLAPPALSTPAGGTRRPSAPPGTSLRTRLPQLSFLFCSSESRSRSQGDLRKAPNPMPPRLDVFDAAREPPILHNFRLGEDSLLGSSKPCCRGAHKGTNLI
jgi:hypothetical protein